MKRSPELEAITRRIGAAMGQGGGGVPALEALCGLSEDTVWIGTDPDEVWSGPEALAVFKAQHDEQPTGLEVHAVRAWETSDAGWAVLFGEFVVGELRVPIRATNVYRLDRGQWKCVHSHTSIGAQNIEVFGVELTTSLESVARAVEVERPDLSAVAPEGTVTLLFTDIEGSTERNVLLGDQEWMAVLRRHHDLVRRRVTASGGFEVKSMGDGFMIAFGSARRALQCAIDIQRAIEKEPGLDVRVRVGLHAGEAVRVGDDFYGGVVNMAARVAGQAAGGEVLVSSLVKALVEASGEFAFGSPRRAELRGIAGVHELHPVVV